MIALRAFRKEVAPEAVQCPGAMIDRAVLRAAIDFCRYTLAWRYTLDPIRTVDGVAEYELDLPGCALIETVKFAQHNDIEIEATTEQQLVDSTDAWRTAEADQASHFFLKDRNLLRIYPIPDETTAKALDVVVALKPSQDAVELPDILYDDHLETIGHGALAKLKAMPGKPWTAIEEVSYHVSQFLKGKQDEKAERLNDYTRESSLYVRSESYW